MNEGKTMNIEQGTYLDIRISTGGHGEIVIQQNTESGDEVDEIILDKVGAGKLIEHLKVYVQGA